jgi:hypothetical protein
MMKKKRVNQCLGLVETINLLKVIIGKLHQKLLIEDRQIKRNQI